MHDGLSVAITVATILGATFFSNAQINSLRSEISREINSLRAEVNATRSELLRKMDSIERDMREFYAEQARHDSRITALERASAQQ